MTPQGNKEQEKGWRGQGRTYGTNEGVALFLTRGKDGRDTKVDQLHLTGLSKKNVCSFDITVNDAVLMKVLEATKSFTTNQRDLLFLELDVPDLRNIRDGTSTTVVLGDLRESEQESEKITVRASPPEKFDAS